MAPRRVTGKKASSPAAQASTAIRLTSSAGAAPRSTVAASVPAKAVASHGRRGAVRKSRRSASTSAASAARASQPSGSSEPSCKRAAIQRQVGHRAAVWSASHSAAGARSMRSEQACRRGWRRIRGRLMAGCSRVGRCFLRGPSTGSGRTVAGELWRTKSGGPSTSSGRTGGERTAKGEGRRAKGEGRSRSGFYEWYRLPALARYAHSAI